jgi:hypothetical protein
MPWFSDRAGPTSSSRITPLAVLPSAFETGVAEPPRGSWRPGYLAPVGAGVVI